MNEKEELKQKKYEKLERRIRQWQAGNEKATLSEIEEAIDRELAQLRQELIEGIVEEREGKVGEGYVCPHCQEGMVKNGQKKRRLKTKGGKEIEIEREQLRCLGCGMTIFPPG